MLKLEKRVAENAANLKHGGGRYLTSLLCPRDSSVSTLPKRLSGFSTKVFIAASMLFAFILALSVVSASAYYLEFSQVGNKIVIKQTIDGQKLESYVDSELLDKAGSDIYFVKRIVFNQSFSEAEIRLNLDKGVVIKDRLVFPEGYEIETDGQIISIVWSLKNVAVQQNFAIAATLEDTGADYSVIYWLVGIAAILLAAYIGFKKFGKLKNRKQARVKSKTPAKREKDEKADYDYLLDTEKRVIEELKKADRNELWQKQIQTATGFSKAKVSRLVRNLEARALVVKIPFGNTNKVRLK